MNFVELFSGSGTVTEEFKRSGHKTFSVDIRRRKGICEPDLKMDIMKLTPADIPFSKIHALWMSIPCDVWSYAAGALHWRGNLAMTGKAIKHLALFKKCLALIEKLSPDYFFLENPRGRLRYRKEMIDFLCRNNGMIKTITLSSYGFPSTKPTDIFTNALDIKFSAADKFGRGAKCSRRIKDNFTKCQRQKTPHLLAECIREYCEGKILNGERGHFL